MARIEKTVFISYRRKDISWALAVYQYLTSQKYDVFFDYTSIPSGDFEQIIVSNIRARAHFVLILTPTALDRCNEPGDWLRREIETAIDEKRNIIPLFFDEFNFGSKPIAEKLTGKLSAIQRYNGLEVPSGYFMEAMGRLSSRYLNIPLNAVIHPVSTEVRKVVKGEQVAADKALEQKKEDIEELVKPAEERLVEPKKVQLKKVIASPPPFGRGSRSTPNPSRGEGKLPNLRRYGIGSGILLVATLGIFWLASLVQNAGGSEIPTLTHTREAVVGFSPTLTNTTSTSTATVPPFTPTPELGIGSAITSPTDGMTLLYVPAGEFSMGSDSGGSDEKPVHTVFLDPFWIDQTEVTNAMYSNCVKDGECKEPSNTDNYFDPDYAGHPVVYVSWNDASNYCSWADRRLPTEAEWEKAASWDEENQIKRIYPWGDSIDCSFANYYDGSNICAGTTTIVGNYPNGVSPYGALDMAGNVWEWVNDWYVSDYYATLGDNASNPQGPLSGDVRVLRGGSWNSSDVFVRSADRNWYGPTLTYNNIGFRCARSP